MSYSISTILHPHKDKDGKQKIQIRIIYNRQRAYLKTDFKVLSGTENPKINAIVRRQLVEAEDKLLDALREGLTAERFKSLFKVKPERAVYLADYIHTLCERKRADAYKRQLRSLANKVGLVKLSEINLNWLRNFENDQGHLDVNTVSSIMKRIKAVLYRALEDGLMREEQFVTYKVPLYKHKLVDYLTEKEIEGFTKKTKTADIYGKQLAGYYFLLSCFTGWRLSDVRRFKPEQMIQGDKVVLRAKKNNEVVSIPIHTRLKDVLSFVTQHPFSISEQRVRDYVKDICVNAGIKKKVRFHTGRHTFAMLLMANGFTIDEVAELIGDTPLITKVYARVHNESLDKKIRERLG